MDKITIRTTSFEDYESVKRIVHEGQAEQAQNMPSIFAKTYHPTPNEYFETFVRGDNCQVIMATCKDKVIGFAIVERMQSPPFGFLVPRSYTYINDVRVKREFQNKVVGKQLFLECVKWAREIRATTLELNV